MILFALFAGDSFDFRLLSGLFEFFKLSEIVFGSVGIYRAVFRLLSDMYDISDVPETEKDRGDVGNYIPTVADYEKISEPVAYFLFEAPVYDARTAESVAVNVFRNVGAVIYAVLVAEERKRRSVRISDDYYALIFQVENLLFKAIPRRFPYPQKTAVYVPSVFHLAVSFRGEVEVVPPIGNTVAVLEKNIQDIAPRLIAKRRSRLRDSLVLDVQHVVEKLQKIVQIYTP